MYDFNVSILFLVAFQYVYSNVFDAEYKLLEGGDKISE